MKEHEMIYADPPWRYHGGKIQEVAINHYATMSDEELYQLLVAEITVDDCVLPLWATLPKLPEALRLIEVWGFQYKTVDFVWVKTSPSGNGLFLDLGWWTCSSAGIRLLTVRGKPERQCVGISQLIISPREWYSKKLDIVRNLAVILVGDVPCIESSARETSTGWDVWGNEVDYSITLTQSEGDVHEQWKNDR